MAGPVDETWDGTFRGKAQPLGAYAYVIRVSCNGESRVVGGNVVLAR